MTMDSVHAPAALDPRRPEEVVIACIEAGCASLLLDEGALPPEFFDLSTGVAGAVAHKAALYGIRVGIVAAEPGLHSRAFQEFARETNSGHQLRVFATAAEAKRWLEEVLKEDPGSGMRRGG